MNKSRWSSIWHQMRQISSCNPQAVLEVGSGNGLLRAIAKTYGISIETVDIDPELMPDHVASATSLPFKDSAYDLTCAFQVLEHFPFEQSLLAFRELVRVSKKDILVSLPDSGKTVQIQWRIPKISKVDALIPIPLPRTRHSFDGEHYWEIGKRGYSPKQVRENLLAIGGVKLVREFRSKDNPFHRFYHFDKRI